MESTRESCRGMEDQELVLAALLGCMPACDELVRRYRKAVTLVAEGILGSREAAEDAAQESFLLAFKSLRQLREPARFGAWLCAITRHHSRRAAVRDSRVEPYEASVLDCLLLREWRSAAAQDSDPDAYLERAFVRAALHRLPEEHQTVLWLYYFEDWDVAQIARFLSLPSTTVKWRLRDGRERMRRELIGEDNHDRREQSENGAIPGGAAAAGGTAPPLKRHRRYRPRGQHDRRSAPGPAKLRAAV